MHQSGTKTSQWHTETQTGFIYKTTGKKNNLCTVRAGWCACTWILQGAQKTWATTCQDSCILSSSRQEASCCKMPTLNIFWMKAVVSFRRQNVQVSCLKLQNIVWQQSLAFLLLLVPILLWFINAFKTLQFPMPPVLSSIFDLREPDFVAGKNMYYWKQGPLTAIDLKWGSPNIIAHSRPLATSYTAKWVEGCDTLTTAPPPWPSPWASPIFTSIPAAVMALLCLIFRLRTKRSLLLMNSSPASVQLSLYCDNNHWVQCTQWECLCQQKES